MLNVSLTTFRQQRLRDTACSRQQRSEHAVPRFYFHVEDGYSSPDNDGIELRDIDAAKTEAVRFAGAILKDCGAKFWKSSTEWRMVVTNAADHPVFTLRFAADESARNEPYRPATASVK